MTKRTIALVVLAALAAGGVFAQTSAGAVNGMTLNGSTGLIVVPDARVGWERAKFGLDVGYGMVWNGGDEMDHLPRFALSLFQKAEVYGAMQFDGNDVANIVMGGKFQMFKDGAAAVALGGDFEILSEDYGGDDNDSAKFYLAATYGGEFFNMPAVTTATIGWQMLEGTGEISSQFVYGMGFSMSLFPSVFKNYVFWVTDFANFSYVVFPSRVNSGDRGAFNTGVRIHPIKDRKFNLVIDVIGTDLLDDGGRGLAASVSGGMAF